MTVFKTTRCETWVNYASYKHRHVFSCYIIMKTHFHKLSSINSMTPFMSVCSPWSSTYKVSMSASLGSMTDFSPNVFHLREELVQILAKLSAHQIGNFVTEVSSWTHIDKESVSHFIDSVVGLLALHLIHKIIS